MAWVVGFVAAPGLGKAIGLWEVTSASSTRR